MKANRAIKNERAEVGVGTLIVFIAMVLVAAVAAAVLINTTGTLQQRAQATGKEATQEVSSNLKVTSVYGLRDSAAPVDIEEIKIYVQLAAGALPMDLEQLVIRYSDGTNAPVNYKWGAAESIALFEPTWIRPDADPSGNTGDAVMESGNLVELHFLLDAAYYIEERTDIQISLVPEAGSAVSADFTTPATYNDDETITLR